ncbi:MAG: peptidylprolyl isomerase, partial [Acidobacteriota bacterium]
ETRRVSHIFLRWTDPQNRQPVLDRLAAIRRQALDGRPFELLAREHSQSETRHRDGLVGFVERGVFPADFDRVVFDLEPEVPSEVLATADGAHLIYVHNILEARDVAFEDVRDLLRRELLVEQRFERLRQAAAAVPAPDELRMIDRDRLPELMRSAPDEQPLLRVGEVQVTAGELRQQLLPLGRQLGDLADEELPADLLQELRDREILFQHLLAREQAGEDLELPDEQIAAAQRRQLIQHEAQRRMTERLAADSELLEGFRSENALRFSTPLRFVIERLTVPAEPAGMARLEAARKALDAGTLTLQDLATELGGEVESTGWVSLGQLAAGDRRAVQFAPLLRPGEHSPPYVAGPVMTLFAVRDRVEPEALPLAAVRQPVIDAYLEQHGRRLFRELTDELLAEAGFTLAASP